MKKILFGLLGLLFSISANAACNLYTTTNSSAGYIDTSGVVQYTDGYLTTDYISITPSTEYTVYARMTDTISGHGIRIAFYDTNKQFIAPREGGEANSSGRYIYNLTSPANAKYIRMSTSKNSSVVVDRTIVQGRYTVDTIPTNLSQCATCDGQIVTYTSATGTVVQNGTPTSTNPIEPVFYQQGNMVLRKVGDYADSYDATTGKITRRVGVKVLDGTENWVVSASYLSSMYNIVVDNLYAVGQEDNMSSPYSSHFARTTSWISMGARQGKVMSYKSSDNAVIGLGYGAEANNLSGFKSWLQQQYNAGTPVTVWYPLATEVEEDWPASYCQQAIKIASTKYVETQFSGLSASLAAAVATVNTVVTNTITQAASIATLQSGKQTRPDETCPAGKKCLLVTDENNVPHWYEIFDPINRWMEAFFKTNPNGQLVDGGADFRRWQGNPDFRETYIDGKRDVNIRQWTEASPARTVGGMYQTLPAGDLENTGSWAVEYDGTEGDGVNAGAVYGIAKCTSVAGTFAAKLTSANESAFYELPAPYGETDREGYERAKFKQCWCKMTAVGVPGDDGTAANGSVYPVNPSSSAWVFSYTRSSAANCASDCAYYCAFYVRVYADFRTVVFGM